MRYASDGEAAPLPRLGIWSTGETARESLKPVERRGASFLPLSVARHIRFRSASELSLNRLIHDPFPNHPSRVLGRLSVRLHRVRMSLIQRLSRDLSGPRSLPWTADFVPKPRVWSHESPTVSRGQMAVVHDDASPVVFWCVQLRSVWLFCRLSLSRLLSRFHASLSLSSGGAMVIHIVRSRYGYFGRFAYEIHSFFRGEIWFLLDAYHNSSRRSEGDDPDMASTS
jgi:hypothetical protein